MLQRLGESAIVVLEHAQEEQGTRDMIGIRAAHQEFKSCLAFRVVGLAEFLLGGLLGVFVVGQDGLVLGARFLTLVVLGVEMVDTAEQIAGMRAEHLVGQHTRSAERLAGR